MKSSIVLNEVTVIDHAYVCNDGQIQGGSFLPSFVVTGEVDPHENVVVDFSTIKKSIKAAIDDREDGFDHKLWVMRNSRVDMLVNMDRITVNTGPIELELPISAVRSVDCNYLVDEIGDKLSEFLTEKLSLLYPNVSITVQCYLDYKPRLLLGFNSKETLDADCCPFEMFRYTHGLKNSTSWACQNIAHGHLSFIQIVRDGIMTYVNPKMSQDKVSREERSLLSRIASDLDGSVFIWRENIIDLTNEIVVVQYETGSRGRFRASYSLDKIKVVILDEETTIEHLVSYVTKTYKDELVRLGIKKLLVSEGLNKGALLEL